MATDAGEMRHVHPAVVASFDMGTANFCFFMGRPITATTSNVPWNVFPVVLEFVRWHKARLPGETIPQYNASVVKLLNSEPLVAEDRCQRVYVEQQIAKRNPACHGIASGVTMFFLTRKALRHCPYPDTIHSVRATSKFTYFLLKTPPGKNHKDDRKILSCRIVDFLLGDWVDRGLVERRWLAFYDKNRIKQDDFADSFLQVYTSECKRQKLVPVFAALERLYAYLRKVPRFSSKGSWPLEMTDDGQRRYDAWKTAITDTAALERPSARKRKRKHPEPDPKGKAPVIEVPDDNVVEKVESDSESDDSAIREAKRLSRLDLMQTKQELGHDDLVMLDRRDFDDPGLVLRRERLALQQELEFLQDQADGPDDSEDSAEESDML